MFGFIQNNNIWYHNTSVCISFQYKIIISMPHEQRNKKKAQQNTNHQGLENTIGLNRQTCELLFSDICTDKYT